MVDSDEEEKELVIPEPAFRCDDCRYGFPTPQSVRAHRAEYHDREPRPCIHCSATLKDKWFWTQHLRRAHPSPGWHYCRHCLESRNSEEQLREHILGVHMGLRGPSNKNKEEKKKKGSRPNKRRYDAIEKAPIIPYALQDTKPNGEPAESESFK